MKLSNTSFNNNGTYGLSTQDCSGLTISDCEINNNNWRAYRSSTVAWDCGGTKLFTTRRVRIFNLDVIGNYGNGFWLDQEGVDVEIDNIYAYNNYSAGVFLEAVYGDVTISNSLLQDNGIAPTGSGIIGMRRASLYLNTTRNIALNSISIKELENPVPPIFVEKVYRDTTVLYCDDDTGPQMWTGPSDFTECDIHRSDIAIPYIGYHEDLNFEQRCGFINQCDFVDNEWYVSTPTSSDSLESSTIPASVQAQIDSCATQ